MSWWPLRKNYRGNLHEMLLQCSVWNACWFRLERFLCSVWNAWFFTCRCCFLPYGTRICSLGVDSSFRMEPFFVPYGCCCVPCRVLLPPPYRMLLVPHNDGMVRFARTYGTLLCFLCESLTWCVIRDASLFLVVGCVSDPCETLLCSFLFKIVDCSLWKMFSLL